MSNNCEVLPRTVSIQEQYDIATQLANIQRAILTTWHSEFKELAQIES